VKGGTTDVNGTGDEVDEDTQTQTTPSQRKRQKKKEVAAYWQLTDPQNPEYEERWTKIPCPAGWVLLENSRAGGCRARSRQASTPGQSRMGQMVAATGTSASFWSSIT
jgi:hypothetical protein